MKNKLKIYHQSRVLLFGVSLLFWHCEKNNDLPETENNLQELKNYIETTGNSNLLNYIQWKNASVYNYENESIIYIPLVLESKYPKATLKATKKGDLFNAFYSFYHQKQSNNATISTTINHNIKENLVSSFKSKESKSYIYTKVFRAKGVSTIKEQTKFALINKKNGQNKKNNLYTKSGTIVSFGELDSDGDGLISYEESEIYEGLKCHFLEYDTDANGTLNESEYGMYSADPQGCSQELDEVIIDAPNDDPWNCIDDDYNGICDEDETLGCIDENWNGICDDDEYGGGGSTDEDDQIINELTEKALCIYEKLESSSTGFKNAIKKFEPEFPVAHLKFDMGDIGASKGKTIAPNSTGTINSPDYVITVRLNNNNTNSGVTKRPNLLVVKTIAHEVIHAEMYRRLLSVLDNGGNIDGVTKQDVLDALDGNFLGMYDYFRRHKNWQDQQMATHYRETLARILQEYCRNMILVVLC